MQIFNLMASGYTNEQCEALDTLVLVDELGIGKINFKR